MKAYAMGESPFLDKLQVKKNILTHKSERKATDTSKYSLTHLSNTLRCDS